MVIIIGYPTDSDTDAAEPRNDITCDRSRYAPSRSRTREASTGARGPGSVLSIVLSIVTSTPTVARTTGRRGAISPVPLPERRFVTGRASRATPSWPPFLHRSDHRCPGLAGPRCCGARAVSADACDGASARPVPHAPSRRAPAGPATVRRVLMGSCRATAVTPCACRIAIGMARTARRSAFDVRSTL
jgi:hypothetical protein